MQDFLVCPEHVEALAPVISSSLPSSELDLDGACDASLLNRSHGFDSARNGTVGNSFDWWSALGVQVLTLATFVQQVPRAVRRLRAITLALSEAWSALSASERAIVNDFCRHILQGAVRYSKPLDGRRVQALPAPFAIDAQAS